MRSYDNDKNDKLVGSTRQRFEREALKDISGSVKYNSYLVCVSR